MHRYQYIILLSFTVLLFITFGCKQSAKPEDSAASSVNVPVAEYAGELQGRWYGGEDSGTLTMKISETGQITGSYVGEYNGAITGHVTPGGKVIAKGSDSHNSSITWKGAFKTKNGVLSSGSGTWSDAMDSSSGTWVTD